MNNDTPADAMELKPCPFCGGEAQRFTISEDDEPMNAGGDVITCLKCQASSHVEFGRKENLAECWNTRTPSLAAQDGLVEFAKHTNWELDHSNIDPTDESSECVWRVHSVNGGRNDREWTLLGTGDTPQEAIDAALSAIKGGKS